MQNKENLCEKVNVIKNVVPTGQLEAEVFVKSQFARYFANQRVVDGKVVAQA